VSGSGKLITEITAVVVICAACICGMYYFLTFAGIPQEACKILVVLGSVLTAVGVASGYWIRSQRNTLFWPQRAPDKGEKRPVFLRSAATSMVVLVAILCGIYLLLNSSWKLGVVVILLSILLSLVQLRWLFDIGKDRNTGGKRV